MISCYMVSRDVKEPTHLTKRVGHVVRRCCGLPLSLELLFHIGLTSLLLSPLDRIVQEKVTI